MEYGYDDLGFYHNAGDGRLIVPKRIRAFGWTLNLDHPHGQLVLAGLGALAIAATLYGLSR